MNPHRIVVGALAKKKRVLPPQVEPINLYCLNPPGQGDGAVLLDCGFFIPEQIRPKHAHPVFKADYDALRDLGLEEIAAGLEAHGYPGVDVVISTHGHADHAGLGTEIHRKYNCEFWSSESEGALRLSPEDAGFDMRSVLRANGFYEGRFGPVAKMFASTEKDGSPGFSRMGDGEIDLNVRRVLRPEEVLDLGGERYRVLEVHGHSRGQVLLANETNPEDMAIHGADQIQKNEPPTFLSYSGLRLGLGWYLRSMDALFEAHPEYRRIRRIYPAHASTGHLDRFEQTPIEDLGQWWDACRGKIHGELETALETLSTGPMLAMDLFEHVVGERADALAAKGMNGMIAQVFEFLRMLGRLDYLSTEGWDGTRARPIETGAGEQQRLLYEAA